MILIYTEYNHPRIHYVFQHICNRIWSIPFEITTDKELFSAHSTAKISYSETQISNEVSILKKGNISDLNDSDKWNLHDDMIQCFLLLSRYEEYMSFTADVHQRFPYSESTQFRYLDVEKPFVDVVAYELQQKIKAQFPDFEFPKLDYSTQLTVDIDRVYHHLGLKTMNSLEFLAKKIAKRKLRDFFNYFQVKFHYGVDDLQPTIRDDYDTYHLIESKSENVLFFVQVGNNSMYDHNYDYRNESFRRRIEHLSWKHKIGLHPSYFSNDSLEKLAEEKLRLENITGKPITLSRQHYIRLQFPQTYRNLIEIGIQEDYSLGFPDRIGYRAGTAFPLNWYDLEHEKCTELKLFPFQLMDVTLKNYMNFSPEKSIEKIEEFWEQTKQTGGTLSIILHNQNLSNRKDWKGWRVLLDAFTRLT